MGLRNALRADDDETLTLEPRFAAAETVGRRRGARWRVVIPAASRRREPPVVHGSQSVDLEARLHPGHPDLGVLELRDGVLVGPDGWVLTPRGELLHDLTSHGSDIDRLRMRMPEKPLRVQRLEGVCLSLASNWSSRNWSHFLLDGLGRWELFRRAGYTPDDVDHFYCGLPHPNAARVIERLGIPIERLVTPRKRYAVRADTVLASSFPGRRQDYPEWVVEMHRSAADLPAEPATRRLYVPRTTTRKLANEAELLPILDEHGFEAYDPARHGDPAGDFARAGVVVGAHGAGLANIVFCPPGARVLELIPSDHVHSYWFTLASSAGLRYGYLLGTSEGERPIGIRGPSPFDFRVDVGAFRTAVEWAVA